MTRETVYASLVRLYPAAFRREYEEQMLETFRELSRKTPDHAAQFWGLVLRDLGRSLVREHFEAWTCGMSRFGLGWVSACSLGALASGAAIALFLIGVNLLIPDVRDKAGFVRNVSRNLYWGVYGALIGLVIGSAQAVALRQYVGRRARWIVATAFASGAGFQLGGTLMHALATGNRSRLLGEIGYFTGVAIIGASVGMTQSVLLKGGIRSAVRWTCWSAVAVTAGIAIAACALFFFGLPSPRTWYGLALAFAVLPAVVGLVIGGFTVRPLTMSLSSRDVLSARLR